jgi:hypothetical protein
MLYGPERIKDALSISYRDKKVQDPCVANIEISNIGRVPILGEDYTQSRSLKLELAAPIVTVLSVEHKPESAPQPSITSDGNTFELKPELLVRGEIISTSLLTEGQPGGIKVILNPFGAVKVLVRDREAWEKRKSKRLRRSAATAVVVAVGSTIALLVSVIHSNAHLSNTVSGARDAACGSVLLQANSAQMVIRNMLFFDIPPPPFPGATGPWRVGINSGYNGDLTRLSNQIDDFSFDTSNVSGLGLSSNEPDTELAIFKAVYVELEKIPNDRSSPQRFADDVVAALHDQENAYSILLKIINLCNSLHSGVDTE